MTPSVDTGLAPARTTFENGVVFLAKETRTMPAVTINLGMRAGSICDPADAPGAMFLLSRVIDRGTAGRSADDIAEELDSRGIGLTIRVTRHGFALVCTCLAEDFEPVLALLGDMLMFPSLPEPELATRKGEAVTAIRQDADNPAVRAVEGLMALLYPSGHPYGRRTKGSVEIVEGLTRQRLMTLHRERFAPSELLGVVVGDVEVSRARDAAARVFGAWHTAAPAPIPLPRVAPARRRQRRVVPMMNKAQADIAYGFTTVARADPAYYAWWLMNHVFGQYSMNGRLGDRLRERQGMAYHVSSSLEAHVIEAPLIVHAGVGPENVDRAIASIDEEIARLAEDGITSKELNDSRQYLIYSMPRTLETNVGIANFLQNAEFFGLGLDYDRRLPDLLGAVKVEDVHAAARGTLDPAHAAVVIAGPYEDKGIG